MEATYLKASALLVVVLIAAGCGLGQPKVKSMSFNGQDCSEMAMESTFLVEWVEVPPEFEHLRIHPGSNITRFGKIQKETLESTILKDHALKFVSAEHEFNLYNLDSPPGIVKPTSTCEATSLPSAWGPSDIQTSQAWTLLGTKGAGVTVAVIDSGADITHNLLSSQIWSNAGEIPNNGIDDDGNGYIDDYKGFDFQSMIPSVSDDSNHGTHVAGVIAGQAGPLNFTGIAPEAKIMPLKFINGQGLGGVGDAIAAMEYAVSKGARVINASWGGKQCSDLLKQEIAKVASHGTVFVNAAGNDGKNISDPINFEWPAVFQVPGKITVGAMNAFQFLSVFSNYGSFVDLAAPGETILSLVPPDPGQPDNKLCTKSGTSMATPFVSGVAALLVSARPNKTPVDIVSALNSTLSGNFGVRTAGKLNAVKAGQYLLSH